MTPIWLALHFPLLPLEALVPCSPPSAVVERGRVLLGDKVAEQAGVCPGVGIAVARALLPALTLLPRNPVREVEVLQMLACWAGRFTPRVSLAADTLLLDVGSCLRLFGGLRRLVATVVEAVQALDFTVCLAAAPTPLAAEWLAREDALVFCADLSRLPQHLETLSVTLLPSPVTAALQRFGVETFGEMRALPVTSLAHRIGAPAVQLVAQAFGEAPDPRRDFVFPERFALSLALPASVDNAPALIFAARRLTAALAGWLAARQAGVNTAILRLQHESGETPVMLRFAEATACGERLERVLRERLERIELVAPVAALRLEAAEWVSCPGQSGALFGDAGDGRNDMGALLERLSARLGDEQVYRLAIRDDYRPECATARERAELKGNRSDQGARTSSPPLPRPLCLLETPESLREVDGRPYRQGPLELLSGPERIESGWWDAGDSAVSVGDLRRDYFIAQTRDERWLWIYRECRVPGGWFLHGFFS